MKIGTLTEVGRRIANGRTIVTVRCACGTVKEVYAYNLKNGSTRSCGGPGCKASTKKPTRPKVHKGLTVGINSKELTRAYRQYRQGVPMELLVVEWAIPRNRLYALFRAIRYFGSVPDFYKELRREQ